MTFREFWPHYLQAHNQPATRAVHYCATVIGVGSALIALVTLQPLFLLGIGVAYALAIGSHAVIEKNHSMIRVNPVWGAIADLRMFWLGLTGGLPKELERSAYTPEFRVARESNGALVPARVLARRSR